MSDDSPTVTGVPATVQGVVAIPPRLEKPVVAGYDLVRLLGHGGMGVVWEAFQHRLDRSVALKVHLARNAKSDKTDALWTEALLAARIGDPSIVRVFDVGYTVDDRPYYAMELVDGTDLAALIADGPLAPRKAVAIAADMARAVAAAHRLGVIHRDLKPRNVIIDVTGRARICDFGIAYDARKGDDPYVGFLAGSPPYMAPEQALGQAVSPKTDIWAIGVMLYEMLTGERPFVASTMDELLACIVSEDPPPPSARRQGIHADLDAVVMGCLAKGVLERFSTSRALFETLSAIAEGQRIEIAPTPRRSYQPRAVSAPTITPKPRREEATKHLSWSWRLRSSPSALWPFVADTDRFNKAVGLSPVEFVDEIGDAGVKRTGELKVLGLTVRWREYPFEWIRDREHSVFRWYDSGPISALWNKVTLVPTDDGGTELRHDIWLTPRGVIGQVATFIELDRKLGAGVDRFYRHLDETLVTGSHVDPFEPPNRPASDQRSIVESACAQLVAQGFDRAIVDRLARHLLEAPDYVIASLRPYALADAWGTDRAETVDAFMHAGQLGLLEPIWDVICPKCMIAHESLHDLAHVKKSGTCSSCATSFERDLSETVELVFAPHPSIRSSQRQTFCVGSPARRPHVVLQQVLEPGQTRTLTIELPRGSYRVAGALAKTTWDIVASAVGFETIAEVSCDGEELTGTPGVVKAGEVRLVLRNIGNVEETFRLETGGARDVVSAAAALTHPSFRAFFSKQLLAHGQHVGVRHLAFLFVEVAAREMLFGTLGDGAACAELARLEQLVLEAARNHEGDVVPSSVSMLVVAFPTSLRAVRAALALQRSVIEAKLASPVLIAAHDGRCLALTRSNKSEFFGETLHRGQTLLRDCPPDGIAMSSSFMSDRAVAVVVHESELSTTVAQTTEGPYAGRRVTLLLP